jgi:HTH-type transcriptional regulator, sugar sensing transcriptional regulator
MEQILSLLKEIHFSENEAQIYLYLLKNPGQTVFQIAKDLHLSRSSIYATINSMYLRGFLLLENGVKDLYFAEDPEALLAQLSSAYQKNVTALKDLLKYTIKEEPREPYLNISGYFSVLGKIRTLLYGAEEEVYINTDMDIQQFDDAFSHLERKGVDVYIFSFKDFDYHRTNVHIYSHGFSSPNQSRMMLVIDLKQVLVANHNKSLNTWTGTLTKNQLMVSIITEHIHHDIYLLRLKNEMKTSIFNLYPSLFFNTKFERTIKTGGLQGFSNKKGS